MNCKIKSTNILNEVKEILFEVTLETEMSEIMSEKYGIK